MDYYPVFDSDCSREITLIESRILLEKGDVKSWVEEIKKLNKDDEYYREWSEKGKEYIEKDYNGDRVINQIKELIKMAN